LSGARVYGAVKVDGEKARHVVEINGGQNTVPESFTTKAPKTIFV